MEMLLCLFIFVTLIFLFISLNFSCSHDLKGNLEEDACLKNNALGASSSFIFILYPRLR